MKIERFFSLQKYREIDSYRFVIDNGIAEKKVNFKTDETNDPRDESRFIWESCRVKKTYEMINGYKILTTVWPANDIKNYWAVTDDIKKAIGISKLF